MSRAVRPVLLACAVLCFAGTHFAEARAVEREFTFSGCRLRIGIGQLDGREWVTYSLWDGASDGHGCSVARTEYRESGGGLQVITSVDDGRRFPYGSGFGTRKDTCSTFTLFADSTGERDADTPRMRVMRLCR